MYSDPKYFDSPNVSLPELERSLRAKAVLLPSVKVSLHVEKGKEHTARTWSYPNGLKGYLEELSEGAQPVAPIFEGETYLGKPSDGDTYAEGEGAAWVFAWYVQLTVTGGNCGLPTVGAVRVVLEPKPGLPTDPENPRAFNDVFTDISPLFVINNESGWYEGWMIHDITVRAATGPEIGSMFSFLALPRR